MGRTTTTLTRHSRTASFTASYAAINSISKNNSLNCDHDSAEDGMDSAYDQINQSALTPDERDRTQQQNQGASTLNNDFQEAYKAISSSPWGARLGGFFGSVVKQGENVYKEASQEFSHISQDATKSLTDLRSTIVSRTRAMSTSKEGESRDTTKKTPQESEGVLARLRSEATKRLKEIQKAEDAADEALLKFGTNMRNFLADAIKVTPSAEGEQCSTVLFESKDSQGKRVIHTTRFDAQLHVIHSTLDSFSKDPEGEEWKSWKQTFDVENKTGEIAKDLEKYEELRSAMETLVPDQVAYKDFWTRYYFLRHSIETAEARRRDLLKGVTADAEEEEVAWDEDSDDEDNKPVLDTKNKTSSATSSQTINSPPPGTLEEAHLQPLDAAVRKGSSDSKSVADSEASYDVVGAKSGTTSQAPGSPRTVDPKKAVDDSDDEDWE